MKILEALAKTATQDLRVGPCHWRIRRIASSELIQAGGAFLLAAQRASDPEEYAKKVATDPAQVVSGMRFYEAAVAAGVVGVSADGNEWTECRVVLDPRQESVSGGRLHISALPPGSLQELGHAILALSKDGGAADTRLSSFLGGTTAPPRRARK